MLRRKKFYVLYPEYFDHSISRKQGRRVSLSNATEDMSLKKLVYACKKIDDLQYKVEEDKAFPNNWWQKNGRVLLTIDKNNKIPKQSIIKDLSNITKRIVTKAQPVQKVKKEISSKYKQKTTHSKKRRIAAQKQKKKKKSDKEVL